VIHLSTPVLVVALLTGQDSGQRTPVPASEPLAVIETQALAADTSIRLYEVGHLTGQERLASHIAAIVETARVVEIEATLERLESLAHVRKEVSSTTESLLATIRELLSPPMEEGIQRVDAVSRGSIALVGTRLQHQWLAEFLASASRFDGMIDVQAQIFVLEVGRLAELSQIRSGEVLNAAQVATLAGELRRLGAEVVTSPRVSTYPFQRAHLSIVEQVAYIKDYELKVLPEQDSEIADPVIDVVSSGVQMQLRGVPLPNQKLSIFASLEYSVLERPIRTFETTLGAMAHSVTIQLPQVTRVQLEGRFEVLPGETLLLATVDPAGEHEVLVLLEASLILTPDALDGEER
jgi:hypothetical protein